MLIRLCCARFTRSRRESNSCGAPTNEIIRSGTPCNDINQYHDSQLSRDYAIRSYALHPYALRLCTSSSKGERRTKSNRENCFISSRTTKRVILRAKACHFVGLRFDRNSGRSSHYDIYTATNTSSSSNMRSHMQLILNRSEWFSASFFLIYFSFWIINKLSCPELPVADKEGQRGQAQLASNRVAQAS